MLKDFLPHEVALKGKANELGTAPSGVSRLGHDRAQSWFWDQLASYLAKKNLKQTQQRHRIVELFITGGKHVSAEELHEAVKGEGHNVGLATVYRTLNLLAEAGLASQKSFGDGKHVFEVNQPGEHHDHIVCLDCGAVIEFENDEIERLQEKAARQNDFVLASHRLDLFGRCQRNPCDRRPGKRV
jgi:Fur family ferric uptake transcriptional regulator